LKFVISPYIRPILLISSIVSLVRLVKNSFPDDNRLMTY
jgi:hypothetical protein